MNKELIKNHQFILFLIAAIWIIEIINLILGHSLNEYSLYPRRVDKLYGIISMHFFHWNLAHVISNSIPLLFLGFFVTSLGKVKEVTFSIMFLCGIFVWLFARNGIHAGASALVMGYWSYLISNAVFQRSFKNILIAVFIIFVYWGLVFSLLDFRKSISFEGHIFGFISGTVSAWIWRKEK